MGAEGTKRDKNVSNIKQGVLEYLKEIYPNTSSAGIIALELGIKANTASKSLRRLYNAGIIDKVPRVVGHYRAKLDIEHIHRVELPDVKLHNLTFVFEVDSKCRRMGGSPPALYTQKDIVEKWRGRADTEYFNINRKMYKVVIQYFDNNVTVHLNASKHQVNQMEFQAYYLRLYGLLKGKGVNMDIVEDRIVKIEFAKDYELVTITPKMMEIHDLIDKAWLRVYRKYRNLTRFELGLTWEGEKKIYELFHEFGYSIPDLKKKGGDGGLEAMFG